MRFYLLGIAFLVGKGLSTCHEDNCLQELRDMRFNWEASAFCMEYTRPSNPSAISAHLGNCQDSTAISSACSCLASPTATPSVSPEKKLSQSSLNSRKLRRRYPCKPGTVSSSPSSSVSPPVSSTSSSSTESSASSPSSTSTDSGTTPSPTSTDSSIAVPSSSTDPITTVHSSSSDSSTETSPVSTDSGTAASSDSSTDASPTSTDSGMTTTTSTPSTTACALPAFTSGCGSTEAASESMGQNFTIECGQSYDKSLAASMSTASSSNDCLNTCDSQAGCMAMTFDTTLCTQNCYLFSSLATLTATQDPTSDSASFACAALNGPDPTICGSTMTGPDSRHYQVQCGVAYTGSSSLGSVTASTYQDCFNQCDSNTQCGAFTFDSSICSGNCQLLAYYDSMTTTSSLTANSGFTPASARNYTCGSGICGQAVYGGGSINDGYLIACRSSYSFTQASDISGSPFTAVSFADCLSQCDNNYNCNYMSFDSSKFTANCAMFERGGVSSDVLTAAPYVDSAKALVRQTGPAPVSLSPDAASCPVYTSVGTCVAGTLTPLHHTSYTYKAQCNTQYTGKSGSQTSKLTVNTYAQCLDACDKNNHCTDMTFAEPTVATVDNCVFISGSTTKKTNQVGYDSACYGC